MRHRIIDTFTGPFALMQWGGDDGEIRTGWANHGEVRGLLKISTADAKLLPSLADRLKRYFKGEAVDFGDVELPEAGAFHRRCWKMCRRIPAGETRSYAELAALAGSPGAARAAGQAMRSNPLPIIVPCHRIIGSSGKLHGFAGSCDMSSSGLALKRALLELEQSSLLAAR